MIRRSIQSSSNTPSRTKRNLLILLGGSVATLGILKWLQMSTQKAIEPDTLVKNQTLSNEDQHQRFLALSQVLTAHSQLESETSAQIYQALSQHNPDFAKQTDTLYEFVQLRNLADVEAIVNALSTDATSLKSVVHQIINAWYLGVVDNHVIAYASAFMFDPVRTITSVPSYCSTAPDDWTTQPLEDAHA